MDTLPFAKVDIDERTIAEVVAVLRSGWITTGPKCREFEAALSARLGGRPVRTCVSGTAALELGLRIAEVGPGDEVITTPLTWVASASAILEVGATPVFVDVDPATRNIDLAAAERAITQRTRAIIPVDLAGLPVDRRELYRIARAHGLRVLEDAAQSIGAHDDGHEIGAAGDLVSFSFHPNKNITSIEGGALVLNDEREARAFEKLRLLGVERGAGGAIEIGRLGLKANLTDVAAAVGIGQLRRLDEFNAGRRRVARAYFAAIPAGLGLALPPAELERSNWHMFQPLLPLAAMRAAGMSRADFMAGMAAHGVSVGVHYPPVHRMAVFRAMGWRDGQFPHAEAIGDATITLPMFPAMRDADVARVVGALSAVLAPVRADAQGVR